MGVHRKGRARLPRDLAYREPYVPPLEGEIKASDFDRRLAEMGWMIGPGDTRTETPPMTKTRTKTDVNDDVRVPPHFNEPDDAVRTGSGGSMHRDNDEDDQDEDDYDQDEEESDERVVKSGDDDSEDEPDLDEDEPVRSTKKPWPEPELEDEPENEPEDEPDLDDTDEDEPEPVKAPKKPEPARTQAKKPDPEPESKDEPDLDDTDEDEPEPVKAPVKKPEPAKAPVKKPESTKVSAKKPDPEPELKDEPDLDDTDEDEPEPVKATPRPKTTPKRNRLPKTEPQPSQEMIDAVAGALTGPVVDAVTARLEAMLPKPRKAERVEKPKSTPEPEVARVQVQPFTSDHVYALARRPPTSLRGVRDLAMLMLGLSMALRRSEIVALRLEHVAFSEDGIAVVMPKSRDIQFVPTVVDRICTVAALANWVVASGIKGGYLFRRITNDKLDANRERRLQKKETTKAVKRAMRRVGLDPAGFDWRSLRAGFLVAYEASRTVDQKIDALRRGS